MRGPRARQEINYKSGSSLTSGFSKGAGGIGLAAGGDGLSF